MPELPEVQTVVDDLSRKIVGKKIISAWTNWPRMIKYPATWRGFVNIVKGEKITNVSRRGKYIKIHLTRDKLMAIHLKMSGVLLVAKEVALKNNKFIHLKFYLNDGRVLAFSDIRKFGTVRAGKVAEIENLPELKNLGPEPLDESFKVIRFIKLIKSSRKKIKQMLMDPTVIAGIGNIYSDEALWLARIHPLRLSNSLTVQESKSLLAAIRQILKKSLRLRGTSAYNYRDTEGQEGGYYDRRFVYHREGEKCQRNDGGTIKRIRLGGRSAHFCPRHQKLS